MKSNLQHEFNLILRRKFDKVKEVWKMGDMMEELSIELKAQERIGDVKQNEK